jgi:hypothetical protein
MIQDYFLEIRRRLRENGFMYGEIIRVKEAGIVLDWRMLT